MIDFFAERGGRRLTIDDIENLQDLVKSLGSIHDGAFVVSGCNILFDGIDILSVSKGKIFFNGKVLPFDGWVNPNPNTDPEFPFPKNFPCKFIVTEDSRYGIYEDGTSGKIGVEYNVAFSLGPLPPMVKPPKDILWAKFFQDTSHGLTTEVLRFPTYDDLVVKSENYVKTNGDSTIDGDVEVIGNLTINNKKVVADNYFDSKVEKNGSLDNSEIDYFKVCATRIGNVVNIHGSLLLGRQSVVTIGERYKLPKIDFLSKGNFVPSNTHYFCGVYSSYVWVSAKIYAVQFSIEHNGDIYMKVQSDLGAITGTGLTQFDFDGTYLAYDSESPSGDELKVIGIYLITENGSEAPSLNTIVDGYIINGVSLDDGTEVGGEAMPCMGLSFATSNKKGYVRMKLNGVESYKEYDKEKKMVALITIHTDELRTGFNTIQVGVSEDAAGKIGAIWNKEITFAIQD